MTFAGRREPVPAEQAGVIVMAKSPLPGRVKTRLFPPCSAEQAAALAEASLVDTLGVVTSTSAGWWAVALDGEGGPWLPPGVGVVASAAEASTSAWRPPSRTLRPPSDALRRPGDRPTPPDLAAALLRPSVDAVIGPAPDGGYWTLGLRVPNARVFIGVPMSQPSTLSEQKRRLRQLALRTDELPVLRDVHTMADARAVAVEIPQSAFASALAAIDAGAGAASAERRGVPAAGGRRHVAQEGVVHQRPPPASASLRCWDWLSESPSRCAS